MNGSMFVTNKSRHVVCVRSTCRSLTALKSVFSIRGLHRIMNMKV